jgi:hypothetical protein
LMQRGAIQRRLGKYLDWNHVNVRNPRQIEGFVVVETAGRGFVGGHVYGAL